MRVQLEGQTLRLRIDEAELAQMLDGGVAENRTCLPDGRIETQQVRLAGQLGWQRDDSHWRVDLPDPDVRALGARLPSREGVHFDLSTPHGNVLRIQFDVDVRDSARKRLFKSTDGGAS